MQNRVTLICQIIHSYQKERGSLCLYLASKSKFSESELLACIDQSNKLVDKLLTMESEYSKILNKAQIKSYNKIENIIDGFQSKTEFRKDISKCKLNINDVVPLYTHRLIIHLTYVVMELALFADNSNPTNVSAISNFINWKERIGRERALGVIGFAMNEFSSEEFSRDFNILLDEQKISERSFLALASPKQKRIFENYYEDNEGINGFHQQLKSFQVPKINAQLWFKLVTKKMEIMHQIELLLFEEQICGSSEFSRVEFEKVKKSEKSQLLDFPFFNKLSDEVINEILKLSNLQTYKKGSMLFVEGEPAIRIFVILSGWVKIFKSSSDGNETVERMLTSGDIVIESTIFASDKYYTNAQVSNEAELLSFPSSIYRELLKKDLDLALNSLKYLSMTSRSHMNQIDSNRIKTSKERVGRFLLKQFVEQKNPNTILLPYEKTIIASLLDMKPETFSRSLKSFKKEGLKSEKHQIQIENMKILCGYCDAEIASQCQFKDKNDCKFEKQ